jgi:hypothetical protein
MNSPVVSAIFDWIEQDPVRSAVGQLDRPQSYEGIHSGMHGVARGRFETQIP